MRAHTKGGPRTHLGPHVEAVDREVVEIDLVGDRAHEGQHRVLQHVPARAPVRAYGRNPCGGDAAATPVGEIRPHSLWEDTAALPVEENSCCSCTPCGEPLLQLHSLWRRIPAAAVGAGFCGTHLLIREGLLLLTVTKIQTQIITVGQVPSSVWVAGPCQLAAAVGILHGECGCKAPGCPGPKSPSGSARCYRPSHCRDQTRSQVASAHNKTQRRNVPQKEVPGHLYGTASTASATPTIMTSMKWWP